MRMFLLLLLLLTPLNAVANVTSCSGTSNCAPGCHLFQGACELCSEGEYCEGGNLSPQDCPEAFEFSDFGATTYGDCYTKISCGGNDVKVYADSIWDNENHSWVPNNGTTWDNGDDEYHVQGTYDENVTYPSIFHHIKISYYFGSMLVDDPSELIADAPDKYHIEAIPHYSAPNRSENEYWKPNSFTFVCVPNTKPCSDFKTQTHSYSGNQCGDYCDETSASITATNCPNGATVNGDATWTFYDTDYYLYGNIGHWDVSNCTCNGQNAEIESAFCYGNFSTTANTDTSSAINTVHTIYENVIYQIPGHDSNEVITCKRCFEDNKQGLSEKYFVPDDAFTEGKVTACNFGYTGQYGALGWYRDVQTDGFCGATTQNATSSLITNPCKRTKCVNPGESTNTLLPIGADSCKYTAGTKFCDTAGCFNLSDIGSWNFIE